MPGDTPPNRSEAEFVTDAFHKGIHLIRVIAAPEHSRRGAEPATEGLAGECGAALQCGGDEVQ